MNRLHEDPEIIKVSEEELILRAQSGDSLALDMLISRNYDHVLRVLIRKTKDPFLAEDLTQETFLKLSTHIHTFEYRGKPLIAWLSTVASNLFINHTRRSQTTRELVTLDGEYREAAEQEVGTVLIEDTVIARESIRAALMSLPIQFRQTVIDRHIYDMTDEDVALREDISPNTVRSRIFRARQILTDL